MLHEIASYKTIFIYIFRAGRGSNFMDRSCAGHFKVVDVKMYQIVKNDYLLFPQFFLSLFLSSDMHQFHHLDG